MDLFENILVEYVLTNYDEAGATKYYGYLNRSGNFYIVQKDETAFTYRYYRGDTLTAFTAAWTGRVGLTYGYFSNVF